MLEHMKNAFNQTTTENGADSYNSTQSDVLDLFSQGGAMRHREEKEIISMFTKAFAENPTLALRTLFYLRDVRGGQGERRLTRICLTHLGNYHTNSVTRNLTKIPEYGRWDDLLCLLDTPARDHVVFYISEQLASDMNNDHPSQLAKWMPSIKASNSDQRRLARMFARRMKITHKSYRKMLSSLRAKIGIVETKITDGNYGAIDYTRLPSLAGMKYRKAFFRNDEYSYKKFLDGLSKGTMKVNSATLYPHEIVGKLLGTSYYSFSYRNSRTSKEELQLLEGQWKNLPDYLNGSTENALVMADVSGSMMGLPIQVSISLAMYIAERNKGVFNNHFMTFSGKPQLVSIKGTNLQEKVGNIARAEWGMNTDVEAALLRILSIAKHNNVPAEEIPKRLYIVSDMQFDEAQRVHGKLFEGAKNAYNAAGYEFPEIVFWNVDARPGNLPMTMHSTGVKLVSGFSPSILKNILGSQGQTPYDFMMEVLESDRYKSIEA